MCGIFGVIGQNFNIEKNLDLISHRGPDDQGIFLDKKISLGFKRLSIIDLSERGRQPMTNEDSSVWIVFNGEIYNFVDLKKSLGKHKFKSSTDTEVILHGYEEWGIEGLLEKINGMFAFCLYDSKKNKAYLVRDRIGKKPLYYYQSSGYIAFSSETKAFFKLDDFNFNLDEESFNLWLGFPYLIDEEKTLIRKVRKVRPGTYLEIETDNLQTVKKKYWSLKSQIVETTLENAVNSLENLLIDSVKKRMVADVPVGILLSGGLDSSLITALARAGNKGELKTINISFENSAIDESAYAKQVADHCKTTHINLKIKLDNTYKLFKENIRIFDDLNTADGGLFSTYLLAKEIRKLGVKVVLVGEGADEVFGGYSWFQLSQYPFSLLPDGLKSHLYYYAIMRIINDNKYNGFSSMLNKILNEKRESYFKKIQRYEICRSLPNHYCLKIDKGCSAASIEARAPYLDYRVVEFARSLPDQFLLKNRFFNPKESNEKYVLRKIAEKYLPKNIAWRKKRGGMLPVDKILEFGLKNDSDLMLGNSYLREFFTEKYIKQLIKNKPSNQITRWQREWLLWKMLIFSLWFDYNDRQKRIK